jgi:hypothetical protein
MRERVVITYDGHRKKRPYVETYDLDLELFKGLRHINRKDAHEATEALEKIAKTMGSGVRVETTSRDRSARHTRRGMMLTQARRIYRQDGRWAATRYMLNDIRDRSGWSFWD